MLLPEEDKISTMASTPSSPSDRRVPTFTPPVQKRHSNPLVAWGVAGVVVLILLSGVLLLTRHQPSPPTGTLLPLDPYAPNLVFSQLAMSESTSLSGGKSTFIDGHVKNTGTRTISAASLQVLFPADQPSPQVESLPLTLVRTHDPYIDIEPVSAAPIFPGEDREFRLIFEDISPNWNQQIPEIHLTRAVSR